MEKDESKKTPELKPREVKVIRALSDSENQKLRVAAYCRVSTDSEDQVNSFIAQVKYYNDFIRLSDTMELVDIYADEGITGTSTEKRNEFNRMIRDCKLGKIDRVFVKSVSRFARNSLECIENIRLMKSYGTTVLFLNFLMYILFQYMLIFCDVLAHSHILFLLLFYLFVYFYLKNIFLLIICILLIRNHLLLCPLLSLLRNHQL